ncbi:hypothetical protein BBB56_09525 [Candidatus Pantoea deserta]|uniref:Uncharacterized protein n=1 Tax=Candidatus Pantoea deserta TaxID=1869313 RepID=A0A3N4PPQ6_9GAMM|nr:hypothetical protein BBB56_09525 [Pantoea deserta]
MGSLCCAALDKKARQADNVVISFSSLLFSANQNIPPPVCMERYLFSIPAPGVCIIFTQPGLSLFSGGVIVCIHNEKARYSDVSI